MNNGKKGMDALWDDAFGAGNNVSQPAWKNSNDLNQMKKTDEDDQQDFGDFNSSNNQ